MKAGVQCELYCLYNEFRHSESLLSVLGMVRLFPESKSPEARQGLPLQIVSGQLRSHFSARGLGSMCLLHSCIGGHNRFQVLLEAIRFLRPCISQAGPGKRGAFVTGRLDSQTHISTSAATPY